MDLVAFLRARLAEDERDADDIHDRSVDRYADGECVCEYPARVLAEVEAKRRIVDLHPHSVWPTRKGKGHLFCDTCDVDDGVIGGDGRYCLHLRLLAAPHATHKDYREEWRP